MSTNSQYDNHVLTSWKEIASHLRRGVRTVQRWEMENGLPVRRPSPDRNIVLAIPSELDDWVSRRKQSEKAAACCSCKEELAETKQSAMELWLAVARLRAVLREISSSKSLSAMEPKQASRTTRQPEHRKHTDS
jgi:hypothetical protein